MTRLTSLSLKDLNLDGQLRTVQSTYLSIIAINICRVLAHLSFSSLTTDIHIADLEQCKCCARIPMSASRKLHLTVAGILERRLWAGTSRAILTSSPNRPLMRDAASGSLGSKTPFAAIWMNGRLSPIPKVEPWIGDPRLRALRLWHGAFNVKVVDSFGTGFIGV